jgi:hypothetical protein
MNTIELNNKYLKAAVQKVLTENPFVEEIIETGTHLGTGSTQVWANTGLPVKTIEANRQFYEEAKKNLKDFNNVQLYYGFSLLVSEMEAFIRESEEYYNSARDGALLYDSWDPVNFYLTEVNGKGFGDQQAPCDSPHAQNLLPHLTDNDKNQIIFLDSSGGVGFLEYQTVMQMPAESLEKKILFLDDINHVKHHRSALDLEERGYNFVRIEDDRSGYCVLKRG